jgi:nicotinamidase-related amidase
MRRNVNNNDLAILVIDMQEIFLRGIQEREMLVAAQQNVLRYAAEEDVPVAVLTMAYEGPTVEEIKKEVQKVPRKSYIEKYLTSGFFGTKLEQQLRTWERDVLLLMGIYASQCVQATAKDGLEKDFTVMTHTQLIGDQTSDKLIRAGAWYKKRGCLLRGYRQFLGLSRTTGQRPVA